MEAEMTAPPGDVLAHLFAEAFNEAFEWDHETINVQSITVQGVKPSHLRPGLFRRLKEWDPEITEEDSYRLFFGGDRPALLEDAGFQLIVIGEKEFVYRAADLRGDHSS
jgi:hypothetical protein